MTVIRKTYELAEFKALPGEDGTELGKFEALVSVFGNVDLQGDRVVKGAFEESIVDWRESGDPIPVIWSHDWGNPQAHIGYADPNDVEETDDGLKVVGTLDLDNPFAAQVFRLMKGRRVKEFSFAYEVHDEKTADDRANELLKLGIIEVGPTLKGANQLTELLGVKHDLEEAAAAQAEKDVSADEDSGDDDDDEHFDGEKAVDTGSWDGGAAMSRAGNSDDPAAAFAAICAGRRDGPADEAGSWALPHHANPGDPPNQKGVSSALGYFDRTQGLTNRAAALAHLERHRNAIERELASEDYDEEGAPAETGAKAGRVLSAKNETLLLEVAEAIEAAHDKLKSVLGFAAQDPVEDGDEGPAAKAEEPEAKTDERGRDELLRLKAAIEAMSLRKEEMQ